MTTRTDSEAERMRRVPGIEFVDTPTGRMARPVGRGLRVWQIIKAFREFGDNRATVEETFDWLTREQIEAAFTYYALYPEEIDARIAADYAVMPEELRAQVPFMRP